MIPFRDQNPRPGDSQIAHKHRKRDAEPAHVRLILDTLHRGELYRIRWKAQWGQNRTRVVRISHAEKIGASYFLYSSRNELNAMDQEPAGRWFEVHFDINRITYMQVRKRRADGPIVLQWKKP